MSENYSNHVQIPVRQYTTVVVKCKQSVGNNTHMKVREMDQNNMLKDVKMLKRSESAEYEDNYLWHHQYINLHKPVWAPVFHLQLAG